MFGLTAGEGTSAIDLLKKDHEEVEELFDQFEDAKEDDNDEMRAALASSICSALTVHAQIEEELFYPAMRKVAELRDLIDEAAVEHQSLKNLIAQLEGMQPGDDLFDAKVKVLSEYVKHHVKEEEGEIFPEAKDSDIDLDALGRKLAARKAELAGEPGAMPLPARKASASTKRRPRASSRAKTASRRTAKKSRK